MAKQATIWLTRARADSETFAAELEEHRIASIIAPVMHIVPHPYTAPAAAPSALLLTSRHAAHALADLPTAWRKLPTYCVGAATASAANEHGCSMIIPGSSNVMALLPRIAADLAEGSALLYLAGEDMSVDVATLLATKSIDVTTRMVYRAVAEASLTKEIQEKLATDAIDGVAFFSPRSAAIAATLMTQAGLTEKTRNIRAYCLSLNVANAAGVLPWASIHTCHQPTRNSLRELIVSTLANS